MLEVPHHQPLKFFHSCHMHSPQKHLETNISSITIICVCLTPNIWAHLRCHRHFFHSSFYSSFSFSLEKNNVIFLHCNRNTRPNKIEADDSNCTVIYCIFISGLVSFPLWVQKKKMKIDHRFSFFIFLKKLKFDTDFLFSFFYVQKKIKIEHRFSFVIFHFSISKNVKIEHRFSFFIFLCYEKNENWNQLSIFIFPWTQIFIFHFSTFRKNEWL